ncbi:surface carbohydrate biosynthesis protein [Desulfopila sp. IMCC35008]|uniref:surface carbohydrate biosynthesis protein n=1 Tax=Desulfopila sp. IMCC35008 TaxID=2653858 RepID=UPI0013D105AE|nr:surface carbohydrate biosynthesis protein [Desulfopila sp. IMCC35008]
MNHSQKIPVIIPVETKSREFHGKLFLALELLRRGHPVLFGDQVRLWDYCDLIEPSIYLDKSVAATRKDWFERCLSMGHKVVSWDEEGLVFFNTWMFRKLRIDPQAFNQVEKFFAWGSVQKDAICEEYQDFSSKIVICGNPRFDFLREELRKFYLPKVQELKNKFGKMLLVNTNFAFFNHYKTQDELKTMLAHYPLADEPGYLDGWIEMHRVAHNSFIEMVPELLSRYPDYTIVVRPHPSESHNPWLELAENNQRLHVDATGNVHEWILASEAVIHFNCTTAVESYLLGILPIAYRAEEFPRYENDLPNSLSTNVYNLDELWDALESRNDQSFKNEFWNDGRRRIIEKHIISQSGESAAERIANEITGIAENFEGEGTGSLVKFLRKIKRFWRINLHCYRETVNPPDGYTDQKFPGMRKSEIEQDLKRMKQLSSIETQFSVSKYAKNCYWLKPIV